MTSLIGVLCTDGVVIGADSSATFSAGRLPTIEQPVEKIDVIAGKVLVAGTGAVGLGQRFRHVVELHHAGNLFAQSPMDVALNLARSALANFGATHQGPGAFGALVGFCAGGRPQLCEFAAQDFQPEFKDKSLWYVSMGSAQPITDPFLGFIREVFWDQGQPTLHEGIFAATWTLEQAIRLNPGGVNGPIRIAIIEHCNPQGFAARMLDDVELDEHRQNIVEAKARLRDFRREQAGLAGAPVAAVPKPPSGGGD